MSEVNKRTHIYSAEATALAGHLRLPFAQEIETQSHTQLAEKGGYFNQRSEAYRLQSVLSVSSTYSHVAGNLGNKPGEGWITLTTTVVEGLNIMEVLTADRIVGQTVTEHPLVGHVPSISFLGTRFENLRIAGHPVELELDHGIFGAKPAGDAPYNKDSGFIGRVSGQYDRIRGHKEIPAAIGERYNRLSSTLGASETVECSLVNQVAGRFPGKSFGNVIAIPGFGIIILGRLTVQHEDFEQGTGVPKKTTFTLTMIDLNLGCATEGHGKIGGSGSNGGGTGG